MLCIGLNQSVLRIVLNHRRHSQLHLNVLRPHRETAGAQQGIDFRVPAAKIAVGLARVHAVADAHDLIVQALCNGFVERIAGLYERLERIVVQDFGPKIAVIPRGIGFTGEDMRELRHAMAHHDLVGHAECAQGRLLESFRVGHGLCRQMKLQIDQGGGEIFDRGKTLIEGFRGLYLVGQRRRHGFAALVVQREPRQHPRGR